MRPAQANWLLNKRRRRAGGGNGLSISAPSALLFLTTDQPQVPTLSVADSTDGGSGTYTLRIQCTNSGTFTRDTGAASTVSAGTNGTGDVTFAGTLSQINADITVATGDEGFDDFAAGEGTATLTLTRDSDSAVKVATIYLGAVAALSGATVNNNISSGTTLESVTNLSGASYSIINYTPTLDEAVPTVTLSPLDNATDVAVDANMTMTFNQSVRLVVGGGTIVLWDKTANSAVETFTPATKTTATSSGSGSLTFSTVTFTNDRITLNPGADLTGDANAYEWRVSDGVIEDYNGNAYGGLATNEWNFTTAGTAALTLVYSGAPQGFSNGFANNPHTWTSLDFTGCQTGDMACVLVGYQGGSRSLTTVTIGGTTATQITKVGDATDSHSTGIFYVTDLNADTANVAVNFDNAPNYDFIIPFVIRGADTGTISAATRVAAVESDPQDLDSSLNLQAGYLGIVGFLAGGSSGQTCTWGDTTTEQQFAYATYANMGLGSKEITDATWLPSVAGDIGNGFAFSNCTMCAFVIGPA